MYNNHKYQYSGSHSMEGSSYFGIRRGRRNITAELVGVGYETTCGEMGWVLGLLQRQRIWEISGVR